MKLRRILLWLIIGTVSLPLMLIALFHFEQFLGYYPGYPGWKVGEIAAKKRDVSVCKKIITLPWIGLFGPTTSESRITCVYHYAELTKDPSACELLMPSEYGLSCINDVISKEYTDYPDSGFFEFSECKDIQQDTLRQDWCNFVKAHRSHKVSDCEPIHNDVVRKGCILKFQMWDKYPELRHSFYFGKQ